MGNLLDVPQFYTTFIFFFLLCKLFYGWKVNLSTSPNQTKTTFIRFITLLFRNFLTTTLFSVLFILRPPWTTIQIRGTNHWNQKKKAPNVIYDNVKNQFRSTIVNKLTRETEDFFFLTIFLTLYLQQTSFLSPRRIPSWGLRLWIETRLQTFSTDTSSTLEFDPYQESRLRVSPNPSTLLVLILGTLTMEK